jgi:hypothetical protein
MRALISNLFAGVRLAVAAPVELRHFRCSVDQVVFLCAIAIVLSLGYSAWAYGSSEYLAYSLGQEAFHVLLLFFFVLFV